MKNRSRFKDTDSKLVVTKGERERINLGYGIILMAFNLWILDLRIKFR